MDLIHEIIGWYPPKCPDSAGHPGLFSGVVNVITLTSVNSVYLPNILLAAQYATGSEIYFVHVLFESYYETQ